MGDDKRHIAIHEAGHAVIIRVLGCAGGCATIIPNKENTNSGHAVFGGDVRRTSDMAFGRRWSGKSIEEYGPILNKRSYHATIIAVIAGAEAERELLGSPSRGDSGDLIEIDRLRHPDRANISDEKWSKLEPCARVLTRRLVLKYRDKIERVADALCEKQKLTKEEIDALVNS